ncbi:MAG TPA: PP0621 family protein [Fluviicoccus sp.]|nr:PP0621 family protein [Fluviicoccus sp.]
MMGALLRLIVLATLVWLVISFIRRSLGRPAEPAAPSPGATPMRQCRHCGLNIPEAESCRSQGFHFCCEAHRDAWSRRKP